MQKKLIALAIAGLASSAAFAQTNVTVYGIADATFDLISVDDSSLGGAGNYGDFNRVSTNSSYIGFKGTEDLGNGLKALFQFESGVSFDSASGTWASRDSYVGLSGNMGTVLLGNLTGPTRALGAALDVNAGATGIGANVAILGKMAGFGSAANMTALATGVAPTNCGKSTTCTSVFDTRWSNAIAYVSPTFAGFTVVGAYVADENKTVEVTGTTARTTGFDTGIKWASGPWMAAVTYNWFQVGDVQGTESDVVRVGGAYMGQGWSLRAMYEDVGYDAVLLPAGRTNTENRQQHYGLGGSFMVGRANLLAQWYGASDSDNGSSDGANLYEVGVEYSLSKRTMLKASYAMVENDSNAAFDFGINSAGTNGTGSTVQGINMGVRHAF